MVGLEQIGTCRFDIQIGVHNGKIGATLQKHEMGESVICLVIAERHNVRFKHIHNQDRRNTLVFLIDDRTLEHVS